MIEIALLSVTKSHPDAYGHKSDRRSKEHNHRTTDRHLPLLGGRGCRAVAHSAGLGESGHCPTAQERDRGCNPKFHCAPSCRIRSASGKKTIIIARQNTYEHMVSHFIREISNFMCMKYPMIRVALIIDKAIRIVSMRLGSMF